MKRFATMLAVAALLVAPAAMAQDGTYDGQYGWRLSNSNTVHNSNFGTMPLNGPFAECYLWLECTGAADGASGADMSIAFPAGAFALSFAAQAPALNAGSTTDLSLVLNACQNGPLWVGTFQFLSPAPAGDYCLVTNASTGIKATVDCGAANFGKHQFFSIGFNEGGGAPPASCSDPTDPTGSLCLPVSVEDESWGAIKGLYR